MRVRRLPAPALFCSTACGTPAAAADAAAAGADADADAAYDAAATAILADYYQRNPTTATDLGLHQFDGQLEDYSRAALVDELAALARFRTELERIDPKALAEKNRLDREMLLGWLETRRLTDIEIQPLLRDPDVYSSGLANSAFSLIKRDYAPARERLVHLIEREHAMPTALAEARRNLDHPPRVYTEIAIEQIDGSVDFFRTAVIDAFTDVKDPALQAEFKKTNDAVIAALIEYKRWLEQRSAAALGRLASPGAPTSIERCSPHPR